MSSGLDDDYFQEELQRRLSQIGSLRDELWGIRDRADDAANRTATLQQNITRLTAEVGIRRAKANELEDKAALEQAGVEDLNRKIAQEASAGVAEVARLQQQLAELDNAYLSVQSASEDAQQTLVQKKAELGALKAVLEARVRDAERARSELAMDEQRCEERRTRQMELRKEQESVRVKDAESLVAVAASAAATARAELARLQRGVASEKECTGSLEKALRHTEEQHRLALEEASELERELRALDSAAEEGVLADELAAAKMRCQYLSQDLANAKRHALMQTQSIQGALEETRRMLSDHADHARQQTSDSKLQESVALLATSLAEARAFAETSEKAVRALLAEREELEEEVKKAEALANAEKEKSGRERAARVEEELAAARQALDSTSRRVGSATEEARRAELAVGEAERSAREQEELFRSKLEELWRMLRMYQPGAQPLRSQPLEHSVRSQSKGRGELRTEGYLPPPMMPHSPARSQKSLQGSLPRSSSGRSRR